MKPIPIAAYRFEGGNIGSFMFVIFKIYMESCYSLLPPHLLSFSPATRFHYTQTGRRCQCSASAQAAARSPMCTSTYRHSAGCQ